jgi:aryl-alcohol dehydrogenase-like predicted oxidoreductase
MDVLDRLSLPLGFGTSKLRSLDGGLSERRARRLMEEAFDLGIRFFDTAPSYGQGQVETAIGRLPQRVRNEVIICSKTGYRYGRKALLINALKPVLQPAAKALPVLRKLVTRSRQKAQEDGTLAVEIRPAAIRESLAGTLRRMRRQRLDILLLHDPNIESLGEENQSVLDALKHEGLIRCWGVSTDDPAVAHRAVELPNLAVLQVPITATWVEKSGDLLSKCDAGGLCVIGNRVLTPFHPKPTAATVAGDPQRRVAECFSYALSRPGVRLVLCGSTKSAHLRANVQSLQHVLQSA